jgi:hypothetical protein
MAGNTEKTWIPLSARPREQTFTSPGNVVIPYGRYRATVEGRGGTGISGTITGYNTNYNIAYPIANQPIAGYNTNYNVVYPIANRPIAGYNTNYNIAYPIANRPIAGYNTNYNIAYPIANQPIANQPIANYNVAYPVAGFNVSYPQAGFNSPTGGVLSGVGVYTQKQTQCQGGTAQSQHGYLKGSCPAPFSTDPYNVICQNYGLGNAISTFEQVNKCDFYYNPITPGNAKYNVAYGANYNVSFPAGNYNTNYNTNYNIAYPIANRPIAGYNTNYNIAYPIANQPIAGYNTNYNIAYPIANQPIAGYNTNYNVVYPIANQPIAGYNPGNPAPSTTVLGVTLPGGGVSGGIGQLAPTVPATLVDYWKFPDAAPSATYPVTVPTGGSITVKIE